MSNVEVPDNGPLFTDFLSEAVGSAEEARPPYEQVTDTVKLKAFFDEKLEDYNMEPGFIPMDLVLFKDAIGHVLRVARVLKQVSANLRDLPSQFQRHSLINTRTISIPFDYNLTNLI